MTGEEYFKSQYPYGSSDDIFSKEDIILAFENGKMETSNGVVIIDDKEGNID